MAVPPTTIVVPTYNDLAMDAPPAVVIVPPLLELEASVELLIPIPPERIKAPVLLLVDAVDSVFVNAPELPRVVTPPKLPVKVRLRMLLRSLLESTTSALLAVTVPAVIEVRYPD